MSSAAQPDAVHYTAEPVLRGIEAHVQRNVDLQTNMLGQFKGQLQELAMFLSDTNKTDLVGRRGLGAGRI